MVHHVRKTKYMLHFPLITERNQLRAQWRDALWGESSSGTIRVEKNPNNSLWYSKFPFWIFFFFNIYNWNDPLISKFYFKSDIGEVSWAPHQFWNGRMFYKQSWIGWFIIITLFVGISTHSKGKILNWQTPHKKQTRTTVTCSVLKTMCAPYDLLPQRRKFW